MKSKFFPDYFEHWRDRCERLEKAVSQAAYVSNAVGQSSDLIWAFAEDLEAWAELPEKDTKKEPPPKQGNYWEL